MHAFQFLFHLEFSVACILCQISAVGERACWDDARPAVTGVWLPPTRPADHALGGKPLRQHCDEASSSHVCWLLPLRPWGRGGSAAGQQWRRSLLNPRLPSFRASRGQRGGAAVEAFSAKSPPSFLQGFTRAARGEVAAQGASRGASLQ
ncbi:unnamed protein product [Closterium sp. NIES-65]|nr:unnamed protein product [Closterium sp. NIES-65]